ncbi:Septum formation protein Maf [Liberibacter crescens BT-1]|uniref:Nucleoside triphosphate pyrophosphatase n=1 Tax=Liberibacter crescens (strain BT-1) TaxID=1215343 RepID=L0EWM8_LIBCB|nr:Maf family protein [Liberibacter crescens]AGA65367.1 Septum formation protein Maf [Liberibacter crescens BT-1]AMC12304.1 septum formation inhibitor Maf [Liberibacter crescens]
MCNLILASSSIHRRKILKNAGINFIAMNSNINEREIEKSLDISDRTDPVKLALILAQKKALALGKIYPEKIIIGCDQTMSSEGKIYHKPKDMTDAENHLFSLSGNTHYIHSSYVLVRNDTILASYVSEAKLKMRILSIEFIQQYLKKSGEKVLSSVGAYQIEKEGIQLFETIEGSFFTILGLPILELLKDLRKERVID